MKPRHIGMMRAYVAYAAGLYSPTSDNPRERLTPAQRLEVERIESRRGPVKIEVDSDGWAEITLRHEGTSSFHLTPAGRRPEFLKGAAAKRRVIGVTVLGGDDA